MGMIRGMKVAKGGRGNEDEDLIEMKQAFSNIKTSKLLFPTPLLFLI